MSSMATVRPVTQETNMSNVLTSGIYHGVDDVRFQRPWFELQTPFSLPQQYTDMQLQALMIERVFIDLNEMDDDEATKDKIGQLAIQYAKWAYWFCIQDVAEDIDYVDHMASVLEEYGDIRTNETAYAQWRSDRGYDNDTLSHFTRVLTNKIKWSL